MIQALPLDQLDRAARYFGGAPVIGVECDDRTSFEHAAH
jgi:hypothetical protein